MKDVFVIQSDVAQKIAAALKAKLLPEERKRIEQIPTENITAYDYYLKGRQYYLRYQKEQNETAIQLYQKAIQVDPNFALAYVGLCDGYSMRNQYGVSDDSLDVAIDTCKKALSIDPNLALAHATIYKAYTWKGMTQEGEEALRKAYELDPNDPVVVGRLASDYANKGKLEEAFRFSKKALELDPTNSFPYYTMGVVYLRLTDFRQSEDSLKKSIELQPDLGFNTYWLTIAYLSEGKAQKAIEAANKLNAMPEGGVRVLGFVESMLGNYPKAIEYFRKTKNPDKIRFAHALHKTSQKEAPKLLEEADRENQQELMQSKLEAQYDRAAILVLRGKKEEALKQLEKACDLGFYNYHFIQKDPIFEGFRADKEFQRIMVKMKSKVAEIRRRIGLS